ncbi:MAG: hypothetical protein JSV81_16435 [Anaerolineales bacterium]|nr:MAG: hypothetical protein JSV81_16435 [Anaerolineales bacterium]
MKKIRVLNLIVRIGLFALILSVGTMAALVTGEEPGLALADLSGASVQAVVTTAHGNVVYAGLIGGPQPTGIYRTDDNGRTWQIVSSGPGVAVNALAVHPANDSVVYAGTSGGPAATTHSLWRSVNGGQTWHSFTLDLPTDAYGMIPTVTALAVDPAQPRVLYVGTDGQGVYRFDEGRNSYELIGGVSLYNAHVNGLVIGPDSRVYALTNDGLFFTDGYDWQKLESLPELAVSLAVAPSDPQTLYAGGASTGAFRATDGGQAWERITNGLEMVPGAALRVTALSVDDQDSNHVVVATAYGVGSRIARGAVYESNDAGLTWIKLAEADGVVINLTFNQGIVYAATANGLSRYGEPRTTAPAISLPDLRPLADPTGVQMLILVLTIALSGLALVGRREWRPGHPQAAA